MAAVARAVSLFKIWFCNKDKFEKEDDIKVFLKQMDDFTYEKSWNENITQVE